MLSCLIIFSNCPDLCLIWGSLQMHSGRLVVNIDFQPLGLKSDCKKGVFWGLKFKIYSGRTKYSVRTKYSAQPNRRQYL